MIVFIKVILVLVAIAIGVFLAFKFSKKEKEDKYDTGGLKIEVRPKGFAIGIILIAVILFSISGIGQIESGYRGVVLKFGAVTDRTLDEGLYFVAPLVDTVELMDVQTHAYEAEASAASKDLQDAFTKVTLNYNLDPDRVNKVYQTLRRDYVERIVKPAVQESVKAITAQFNAEELITKRAMVKGAIEQDLKSRLDNHGMLAETISITDFDFSEIFTQAIEAKVSAAQKALEAENKLRQIEVEARQVKAAAEGQRDAEIAKAEGQQKAAILVAEGKKQADVLESEGTAQATLNMGEAQQKYNEMLAKSLQDQPELLKYILYQKLGDDIKVIILPSGQEFILGPEVLGN